MTKQMPPHTSQFPAFQQTTHKRHDGPLTPWHRAGPGRNRACTCDDRTAIEQALAGTGGNRVDRMVSVIAGDPAGSTRVRSGRPASVQAGVLAGGPGGGEGMDGVPAGRRASRGEEGRKCRSQGQMQRAGGWGPNRACTGWN